MKPKNHNFELIHCMRCLLLFSITASAPPSKRNNWAIPERTRKHHPDHDQWKKARTPIFQSDRHSVRVEESFRSYTQ